MTNTKLYMENGRILVDAVFDYDHMWRKIGELARQIGQSMPKSLPKAKSHTRIDRRPAAEILKAEQKRRIQQSCAVEFERFGYEP